MSSRIISLRIWFLTSIVLGCGFSIVSWYNQDYSMIPFGLVAMGVSAVASLPALIVLLILLPFIKSRRAHPVSKWQLLLLLLVLTCFPYGIIAAGFDAYDYNQLDFQKAFETFMAVTGILFACNAMAVLFSHNQISCWINSGSLLPVKRLYSSNANIATQKDPANTNQTFSHIKTYTNMTNDELLADGEDTVAAAGQSNNGYNRTLIKAGITAALILAMLIPAKFITSLVQEREQRQKEVTEEVSSKWAKKQTISTPYLCIPYITTTVDDTGKKITARSMLYQTAGMLNVKADMRPEMRKRSIYNVLLYKSNINLAGNMSVKLDKGILPENLLLNEARLCIGISDFKGIDEKVTVNFNNASYELEPGLPDYKIDKQGLSAPVTITPDLFTKEVAFTMNIKIKGSEQLHFLPLSDNSNFEIVSPWRSPSFDGSSLPKDRVINDSGFTARWSFNKANMPVLSQLLNTNTDKESMAFGVTMVQPADQYAKTNRSVKYAILFVGLTFAMFFIIELMQKKNVHPVQYVLIGLALIIFYTLLLSISEFTGFNIAYAIAGSATVILIGIYAGSLFASVKTSLVLSTFIGLLYGFIYVLIQLEDTALLAGSIGLFGLLAVAMYFSKRINWYGSNNTQQILTT